MVGWDGISLYNPGDHLFSLYDVLKEMIETLFRGFKNSEFYEGVHSYSHSTMQMETGSQVKGQVLFSVYLVWLKNSKK